MQQPSFGSQYISWAHRDALGLQENGQAYDPFGNLIYNVQPPNSGPPPYHPFYGATYGGASWNSFTNANNLSSGCYSAANNNPTVCNDRMLEVMGPDFVSNLPGHHDDLWQGENNYLSQLNGQNNDPNNYSGVAWVHPKGDWTKNALRPILVFAHVRHETMLPPDPQDPKAQGPHTEGDPDVIPATAGNSSNCNIYVNFTGTYPGR